MIRNNCADSQEKNGDVKEEKQYFQCVLEERLMAF